jgi:mRNA interferase MazF
MTRMIFMRNYSKGDIVLLPFPFTDLSVSKVRPQEFIIDDWEESGLNVLSAVKRGCALIDTGMIKKKIGALTAKSRKKFDASLKLWF